MIPAAPTSSVLVVEDDPGVRSFLAGILSERGVHVTPVDNVDDACQSLKANDFALILTDLCLESGSEGLDVARAAQTMAPRAHVVLYSGYDLDAVAAEAEAAGVDRMLRKPFGLKELDRLLADLGLESPTRTTAKGRRERKLSDREGQKLLERFRVGDELAFDALVNAYQPMVYSVFMRWFRLSAVDAEDLFQEVLLQLVVKAAGIRNVRMWLLGTAVNQAKKRIRNLIRDRRLVERYMEDLQVRAPEEEDEDVQELILRGMARLKPFDAHLLAMIYLEGLSYQEVADSLERPIGSIGPLRGRALKRLTSAITELETPPQRAQDRAAVN